MRIQDEDTRRVCSKCVSDAVLADDIETRGARSRCTYCGKKRRVRTLGELAERIHEVLQEHFELISTDHRGLWPDSGDPVTDVIADMAGLSEALACDVRELLSDRHGSSAVKDGEDDPYASDAEYGKAET